MFDDRPDVPSQSAGCLGLILLPILLPLVGFVVVLVAVVKLVTLPFERPITRSPADVARILRALLEGTVSDEEWDDFVCISIADKRLDEIRQRCAGLLHECRVSSPPYITAAGQDLVHAYIRELEDPHSKALKQTKRDSSA